MYLFVKDTSDCVICGDTFREDEGVACAEHCHFTCRDCVSQHVHFFSISSLGERQVSQATCQYELYRHIHTTLYLYCAALPLYIP